MSTITMSLAIKKELDKFENLISSLEKKKKDLSDQIKEHEKDVKKAKECSDAWQKCLKTREEKKNSLQKESKFRFALCAVTKNTEMFHRCLVCFRKTASCSFKKKQDIAILMIKEKLFKQQLEMVNNETKDIEKSLESLRKIDQECSKIKEGEVGIEKIFKKTGILQYVKDKMSENPYPYVNFDDFLKQLTKDKVWQGIWKGFSETADYKEIAKFKQDIEHFYNANKKISNDLHPVFIQHVEKRCNILRSYDEGGRNLLKGLEKEAKSLEKEAFSSKIEACRMVYEKERDEYKKSISTVESNYNKVIEIFTKISKSPELNCLERLERNCIIKKYSCDECKSKGSCSVLDQESGCYELWKCINNDQITLQQETLGQSCRAVNYVELKKKYCELNKKEACYEQNQNHLDRWEASITDSDWINILQYEEARNIFSSIQDSIVPNQDRIIFKKETDVAEAVKVLSSVLYCAEQKEREHKKFFIQHAYAVVKEQVAHVEKNKDERMKICLRGEANTFVGQDLYWVIPEMLGTRSRPDCDPKKKEYLEKDPYSISIVDASNRDDFQDFAPCFKIPCDLRGESRIDMCNFVPLCQSQHSCVDNNQYGDLKCDDEPCCPQPSCCGQEAGQTCGQHATCNQQNGQEQTGGRPTGPADGEEPVIGWNIG